MSEDSEATHRFMFHRPDFERRRPNLSRTSPFFEIDKRIGLFSIIVIKFKRYVSFNFFYECLLYSFSSQRALLIKSKDELPVEWLKQQFYKLDFIIHSMVLNYRVSTLVYLLWFSFFLVIIQKQVHEKQVNRLRLYTSFAKWIFCSHMVQ